MGVFVMLIAALGLWSWRYDMVAIVALVIVVIRGSVGARGVVKEISYPA